MTRPVPLLALAAAAIAIPAPAAAASKRGEVVKERRAAERVLVQAKRALAGRDVRSGRELSPLLKDLAVRLPALDRGDRRQARSVLARPTDGLADPFGDGYTAADDPNSPHCTANFCVHWVVGAGGVGDAPQPDDTNGTADGDGVPDYVEKVAAVLQQSRTTQNGTLGWRSPRSDGIRGGDGRVDAYLKDVGSEEIFGYAAPDPGSGATRSGYLVLDDDYAVGQYFQPPNESLEVTAAHEYNHVIQYAYDVFQDTWLFESSAVWMEDRVFDVHNDYARYLDEWRELPDFPMAFWNYNDPDDPVNLKAYGSGIWNMWLSRRYPASVIRRVWEVSPSTSPASFGLAAYDSSIRAHGGRGFFSEFVRFAAATSEWRAPSAGFPADEAAAFPGHVRRLGTLGVGQSAALTLDHTGFGLLGVAPGSAARIKLVGRLPAGTAGAIALVGRTASSTNGAVTTRLLELPSGGAGAVVLNNPAAFGRVTAALVNADTSLENSIDPVTGDWDYAKDNQRVSAFISTDFTAPSIVSRAPADGAQKASTDAPVTAIFSEPVSGVSGSTFQLTDEAGAAVAARVTYDAGSRTATLTPSEPLEDTTLYTARLTSGIRDASLNAFAGATWRFRTVRLAPRLKLSVPRSQRAKLVKRRGVLATLSSRDADKLKFTIALDGRAASTSARVGRKKGSLRAGRRARVRVRLKSAARRRLSRHSLRITLRLTLRDPQGNRRKLKRRLTVKR